MPLKTVEWLRNCSDATITTADAAEVLGLDVRTVRNAIDQGQLPAIRIGRRHMVPVQRLLAMLDGTVDAA